ncbi:MAG: hypothetical protein GTN89_13355 [Acidobacteria bacterium]|nr:hypothetical protein [Acidobacteriota bacterium]NIM60234.1 hypothetical protein [Acidobacteriota bacterium]NIO60272.1 hypothetical protein [Acidobacteriota bacterium]NIQ31327.1 hypothetical protein [Acidobacteriota bacterium]NIQ86550.1 hypothetical protein [Acidobacteriota bacterium]
MKTTLRRRLAVLAALGVALLCVAPLTAQSRGFGKNKVTYERFDWQVYRSPHFDIHYYPSIDPFLDQIVSYAESAYADLSKQLDHELRFRVPLVVYKTHGEFLQTNITLAELPEGVAAFAEPVQYRMVLPIDGPPDELYKLIAHELVHIFQYSMFYEGYLGRALRSNPPTWLIEGLASYLADDESTLDQMVIRDGVVNNNLPPIQSFNQVTFLTYRYGHAMFDYIEQEHGIEGLRSFLFEFKKVLLTGNLGRAVKEAFGYDIDELNRRFNRYLRKKYYRVLLEKKSPDEHAREIRPRKSRPPLMSPTLSPSGELVAALSAPALELDLVVFSAEGEDKARNVTKGFTNKYRNLVTNAFKGRRDLSWSPVADEVAVFVKRENKWPLLIMDALRGKIKRKINFDDIFECASPMFSPDGRRIAFEGNRNGVVDIFEYDLDSGEIRNLTRDDFFDANPWYAADGGSILYNRRIGSHWKIFSVDLADAEKKSQLTYGAHSDLQPSYSRDGKTIFFTSDRGEYDVYNIHSLDLETGDVAQYTDVVGGAFMPIEMSSRGDERFLVFNAFFEGTFRLYRMPLRAPELRIPAEERLNLSVEAEPFKPDLELSVDEAQKLPYKVKWDLEAPYVEVGVTDDGRFLSNAGLQFTDLLGNHRFLVSAFSVSEFASIQASYFNLERKYNWGGSVYDYREFFVDRSTGQTIDQTSRTTGASAFVERPFNRHYRFRSTLGYQDSSYLRIAGFDLLGLPTFTKIDDGLAFASVGLIGDTVRFQRWGPYHGKRFNIGVTYGKGVSGDFEGDSVRLDFDYRAYGRLTRRSLFALRLATLQNLGDRQFLYPFGGINQLRGYDYYEFTGTNLVWSNLEFRFPLVDLLAFPVLAIQDIRGILFLDLGAAYLDDELWINPNTGFVRVDETGQPIKFAFWDSENDRLQDLRGSYGVGFQFLFLGGLQFNWVWAQRLDFTDYAFDPTTMTVVPVKGNSSGTRTQFYIAFDF